MSVACYLKVSMQSCVVCYVKCADLGNPSWSRILSAPSMTALCSVSVSSTLASPCFSWNASTFESSLYSAKDTGRGGQGAVTEERECQSEGH